MYITPTFTNINKYFMSFDQEAWQSILKQKHISNPDLNVNGGATLSRLNYELYL